MGKIPVSTVNDPHKYLNYASLISAISNEDNFPRDAIYLNAPPSFLEKLDATVRLSDILSGSRVFSVALRVSF